MSVRMLLPDPQCGAESSTTGLAHEPPDTLLLTLDHQAVTYSNLTAKGLPHSR